MGYKRWFTKHIIREKRLWIINLIFLIMFIGTVSLTPLLIGDIFTELGKENRVFSEIVKTALLIALAGLMRAACDFTQSYVNEVLAHKVTKNVTEELYNALLEKSQEFHDRKRIGDVMARATYDTRQMNIFISPGLKFLFEGFFTILFSVSLMIWTNAKLTILLLVALPFYVILMRQYNKKLRPISMQQMEQNSLLNTMLQESVTGIRIVRAFVKEQEEIKEFDKEADKLREINTLRGIISAKYYPVLVTILLIASSFIWGAYEVTQGRMLLGQLITYVFLVMTLMTPTWQFGWALTQMQIGLAAVKRIYEMKEAKEYVVEPEKPIKWKGKPATVYFDNVSFSYNGGNNSREVLHNVTFEVKGGTTVAIIGHPGSGKTTLIKLLLRLYDPTEGAIYIDDINIKDMSLENLRRNIGVIEQDVFLFSKTIKENIAYGKPEATMEEIIEVAKLAQAHDFIMEFPEGYDTVVGERGVMLSGGQKQRIAIARALLVNPSILILDDASSAIDAETERKIQTAIANVLKNRTVFIITHRLATIKNAHQILVLRSGRVSDYGTHEELLSRNEDYRNLFARFSELPPLKVSKSDKK